MIPFVLYSLSYIFLIAVAIYGGASKAFQPLLEHLLACALPLLPLIWLFQKLGKQYEKLQRDEDEAGPQ